MTSAERLIVALDVPDLSRAEKLIAQLSPWVKRFKIGSELFTAAGPAAVAMAARRRSRVFLDLKFHDIPTTAAKAAAAAARLGVFMVNFHAQGGGTMLREAVESVDATCRKYHLPRPLLVGVTVLTSLGQKDWQRLGMKRTLKRQVLFLAELCKSSGLDGVVASAQEAAAIRKHLGKEFVIVCPGIRPAQSATGDQSRVAGPRAALRAGADYLVVGRPITEAKEPARACREILAEMEGALKGRQA